MTVNGGDVIYASDLNTIYEATLNRPIGRMVQTVAQAGITNNTTTAVTFTTEEEDSHNYHDTGSNTSRVTPTKAGWYRASGAVAITGQTDYTGVESAIRKNGSSVLAPSTRLVPTSTSGTIVLPVSAEVEVNGSSDYFEIVFRLNRSGAGTSGTVVASQFASALEWVYLRPS